MTTTDVLARRLMRGDRRHILVPDDLPARRWRRESMACSIGRPVSNAEV